MNDITAQVEAEANARVRAFLAPYRAEARAEERANRATALNAAAITVTGSQYGHIGEQESHIQQVLEVAERYATWIRTGEDHGGPHLPPVDF